VLKNRQTYAIRQWLQDKILWVGYKLPEHGIQITILSKEGIGFFMYVCLAKSEDLWSQIALQNNGFIASAWNRKNAHILLHLNPTYYHSS